jgi:exonuclease III
MKLNLVTHNVQGLNDPQAPYLVKNYYQDGFRDIDILCIQEHKLRGDKLMQLG